MSRILLFFLFLPLIAAAQAPVAHKADTTRQLKEVAVTTNTTKALTESPGSVTVVNMRELYESNLTPIQVLRSTPGVKVRQEGGYGSRTDFFINGSTGKQLRFFLDGLPLENAGESLNVSNLPIEQLERVEIYKGVIPVDLGADVLGGAVNLITRKERADYFDASYGIGSFGTHKLNLSGRKNLPNGFYYQLQVFGGYAKNDYSIDANNILPNGKIDLIHVKRFHDRYKNVVARAAAGWLNKTWADELTLELSGSGYDKAIQNNLTMAQPYAYAAYREQLLGAVVKYRKNNIARNLNLSGFTAFNRLTGLFIDTARTITLWDGSKVKNDDGSTYYRTYGAEIGPTSYLSSYTNNLSQKLTLSYRLNDHHKLVLSNTLQYYRRTAEDTLARRLNNGVDVYDHPSSQFKNVAGLGYDGTGGDQRWRFSAAAKYFYTQQNGSYTSNGRAVEGRNTSQKFGYNAALAYDISAALLLKLSYEHAIRLPDATEAFGDLILVNANPDLKPEESDNLNLNLIYHSEKVDAGITGFYRAVDHLIFLVPNSQGSAKSYNLLKARVAGVEGNVDYRLHRWLNMYGNLTFQDLRSRSYIEGMGIPNERYIGQRIPNIPYLLGNAGLSYHRENLTSNHLRLKVWYSLNYTNAYYLYWANDGYQPDKLTIPTQVLQNAGITISKKELGLSAEVYNLTDAKTFDSFKAQLPGRALSLKLRYYITNHK